MTSVFKFPRCSEDEALETTATLLTRVTQWKFVVNFRQFNYRVIFVSQPYRFSSCCSSLEKNIRLVNVPFVNAVCDACMYKLLEQVIQLTNWVKRCIMMYSKDRSVTRTHELIEMRDSNLLTHICVHKHIQTVWNTVKDSKAGFPGRKHLLKAATRCHILC